MTVAVIDYGVGNLKSVAGALAHLGAAGQIVDDPQQLRNASKIILPGVGAFGDAMQILRKRGWVDAIRYETLEREKPLLGICLGMQLLATRGEEGSDDEGLGLIAGDVRRLDTMGCTLRIPHVGWNSLEITQPRNPIFSEISSGVLFYFVHSYALHASNSEHVAGIVNYGIPITAAVSSGSIHGMQFHPEKSSKAGLKLLANFLASS